MFNIGASGQYAMGGFLALLCGWKFNLHWTVCLLIGIVGGAIIGAIPGLLKSFFNYLFSQLARIILFLMKYF